MVTIGGMMALNTYTDVHTNLFGVTVTNYITNSDFKNKIYNQFVK